MDEPKMGEWWWVEVANTPGKVWAMKRIDDGYWRNGSAIFAQREIHPIARISDPPAPEPTEAENESGDLDLKIEWDEEAKNWLASGIVPDGPRRAAIVTSADTIPELLRKVADRAEAMTDQNGQAGSLTDDRMEVTPAMIEAGIAELREKCFGQPLDRVVRDVFWAMVAAHEAAKGDAR